MRVIRFKIPTLGFNLKNFYPVSIFMTSSWHLSVLCQIGTCQGHGLRQRDEENSFKFNEPVVSMQQRPGFGPSKFLIATTQRIYIFSSFLFIRVVSRPMYILLRLSSHVAILHKITTLWLCRKRDQITAFLIQLSSKWIFFTFFRRGCVATEFVHGILPYTDLYFHGSAAKQIQNQDAFPYDSI